MRLLLSAVRSQQNLCLSLLLLPKIRYVTADLSQFELRLSEGTKHSRIWCLQILYIVCQNKDFSIWIGKCKVTIYSLFYPCAQCSWKQMLFSIFSLESMTFLLILSCNSFWILKPLKLLPHQLRASSSTKCYCCNTALMFIVELMIKQIIFLLRRSFR